MKFQYLIYRKQEMEPNSRFLREIRRHMITEIPAGEEPLRECMKRNGILLESALVIAATDQTIREAKELSAAVLGYRNPKFPFEELYGTEFLIESFEELDYYFLERVYQRWYGLPWRVIETKRCYLREITVDDLPELYELYGQKGMTDHMEPLYDKEEELAYTKAYINNMYRYYGYGMWLVKDRNTDELIGRAGFDHLEEGGECLLEMGYAISVFRQRQGYAYEVCRAMIDYAKGAELGFDRIYCLVREGNTASVALLKKLGFRFMDSLFCNERNLLRYVYELT